MASTCYAIAFDGDRFLMVWHPRRGGWEMPGGHIEPGETAERAAARECVEESGFSIEVVARRDIGGVAVFAAVLGPRISEGCEMESRMFAELPGELSFDRSEYEDTVPWAREAVRSRMRRAPVVSLYRRSASAHQASPPCLEDQKWQECTLEGRGSPAPTAR